MPVVINNQTYYRTAEVCRIVGISRNTLFRWLKEGVFSDAEGRVVSCLALARDVTKRKQIEEKL